MSNQIIGPETWGPVVWHALHYITLGYPDNPSEENKQKYKLFFSLLADVLPCSICANHFSDNLIKMPLSDEVLKNKESLIKWLIDFHNVVNEMNKKPIIKYEDARKLIEVNTKCEHNIIYKSSDMKEITVNKDLLNKNLLNKDLLKKDLFSIDNIYYLFGLLLIIILITFLFKKRV